MRERSSFWTPERIVELRKICDEGFNDTDLSKLWNKSRVAIEGRRRKLGIKSGYRPQSRLAVPADFATVGPTMTTEAVAKHYHAAVKTVRTWFQTTGLHPAKRVYLRTKEHKPKGHWRPAGVPVAFKIPLRSATEAASAQLHLQRYGPCFSARVSDPTAPLGMWVVNGRRLTESEMVQEAKRKGYRPEALAA